MKISIVTISFNQAEFVERTIKSVLNQKKDVNIEYIVVDAGSTDGSREIIESYRDQIDHIIFESDDGAADGLNKGFNYAKGDIYGFLNSDDILLPNSLKEVCEYMIKNNESDIISGHAFLIDSNDKKLRKLYSDKFSLNASAYGASILIQPSTFFRKEIFNKSKGFNVKNKSNWDGELFIDFGLLDAKFFILNKLLSGYRVHENSITGTMKINDLHLDFQRRMFFKVKGREINKFDSIISFLYHSIRKIINYRDSLERILNGKSFGRSK